MYSYTFVETERKEGKRNRIAFEIYERMHRHQQLWHVLSPQDTFSWLKTLLLIQRPIDVEIRGFLGRTHDMEVRDLSNLRELWRGWYTQAIQARAAVLHQPIFYPLPTKSETILEWDGETLHLELDR